jgi:hypothetical protein
VVHLFCACSRSLRHHTVGLYMWYVWFRNKESFIVVLTLSVITGCPLSMTVGGCRLLSNEMAAVRAKYFVLKIQWRILTTFTFIIIRILTTFTFTFPGTANGRFDWTFLAKLSLNVFVSYFLSCTQKNNYVFHAVLKQQVLLFFIAWYRKIFLCLAFAVSRITRSSN